MEKDALKEGYDWKVAISKNKIKNRNRKFGCVFS